MSKLPDFFVQYDLPVDTDERAVKRVYARQLKLINQERDLEGFQSLRDAYEEAMVWLANETIPPRRQDTVTSVETFAAQLAEEPPLSLKNENADGAQHQARDADTLVARNDESGDLSRSASDRIEPDLAPIVEHESPGQLAQAVFTVMLDTLRKNPGDDDIAELSLLNALEDKRLSGIQARHFFEQQVACYLLEGWQPGNGDLFDAAVNYFNWQHDIRRLMALGEAGAKLELALSELAEFNKLDQQQYASKKALLIKARRWGYPGKEFFLAHFGSLRHLEHAYPHWIWLVTSRANVIEWHRVYEQSLENEQPSYEPLPEKPVFFTKKLETVFLLLALVLTLIIVAGMQESDRQEARAKQKNYTSTELRNSGRKPEELLELGKDLFYGRHKTQENVDLAIRYFANAGAAGSVEAAELLTEIFSAGYKVNKDEQLAHFWRLKAANLGSVQAQIDMGDYFLFGDSGEKDPVQALQWYRKVAGRDQGQAEVRMAYMYENGLGVGQDMSEAIRLIKQAAEKGHPYAAARIGLMHMEGSGGLEKNEEKAVYWFELSANRGDMTGQRLLANVYEFGLAKYAVNLNEASAWYSAAAGQGDQEAKNRLKAICSKRKYKGC